MSFETELSTFELVVALTIFFVAGAIVGVKITPYEPQPSTTQTESQLEINQSLLDRQKKLEYEVYKLTQLVLRYTAVPPAEYQAWRPEEQPVP